MLISFQDVCIDHEMHIGVENWEHGVVRQKCHSSLLLIGIARPKTSHYKAKKNMLVNPKNRSRNRIPEICIRNHMKSEIRIYCFEEESTWILDPPAGFDEGYTGVLDPQLTFGRGSIGIIDS